MILKALRKCCTRCGKGYLTHDENLIYCNEDCKSLHKYEIQRGYKPKDFNKHSCLSCGIGINGVKKWCDKVCRNAYHNAESREARIIESNAKEKPKSKSKGLSYYELNRRAEYKRLYDDFHIKRQVRGISRDLI